MEPHFISLQFLNSDWSLLHCHTVTTVTTAKVVSYREGYPGGAFPWEYREGQEDVSHPEGDTAVTDTCHPQDRTQHFRHPFTQSLKSSGCPPGNPLRIWRDAIPYSESHHRLTKLTPLLPPALVSPRILPLSYPCTHVLPGTACLGDGRSPCIDSRPAFHPVGLERTPCPDYLVNLLVSFWAQVTVGSSLQVGTLLRGPSLTENFRY